MTNPHHIVCYSGGHSSALAAIEVARKYGNSNVLLLNHDINIRVEDPDIKRFKKQVADYLGLAIYYANHKDIATKDQFDICVESKGFSGGRRDNVICTSRLKTIPFYNLLDTYYANKDCTIYYGFDSSEQNRIQRRSGILGHMGYKTDYPLIWADRTIQNTVEIGIDPPLTYSVFKHANCVGCIKAGKQHWYCVYCTRYDIFKKAMWAEDEIEYSILPKMFLEEIEPLYAAMKQANIEPTEHIQPATFWANVAKQLGTLEWKWQEIAVEDSKPCECVL